MSGDLAFRALQDQLASMQLDISQMKRNIGMGTPIEWRPVPYWPSDGAATEDLNSIGFYVRHGRLLTGWFVTRTTGNSHDGTGPFYVFMPPNYSNAGVPTLMELDELGGAGHVYGGQSVIGYWTAELGGASMHGWISRVISDASAFAFSYTSAYPSGTLAEADGTVFDKNTLVRGFLHCRIKDGF